MSAAAAVTFGEGTTNGTPSSGYGRLEYVTSVGLQFVTSSGTYIVFGTGSGADVPGGRLTLTTATPILTSDTAAAGTLYYTPHFHNNISIYSGTAWIPFTFTERSLALSVTSGKNYDVFIYNNSGTLTLELSAAWTNDTTRADALTRQDGTWVKSGATTRLWLGTIRASGANQCSMEMAPASGTTAKIGVWNYYNQVPFNIRATENADSWTYTTATWRPMNNDTTNRLEYVCGLAGASSIHCVSSTNANNSTSLTLSNGIGVDSTTANSAQEHGANIVGSGASSLKLIARYRGAAALGYHYLQALEYSQALGSTTWYGDAGDPNLIENAIGMEFWA